MSVLTLDEAKMLISNSPVPTTRYSYEQVQRMIEAAEQQVAEVVGPLAPTPVTVSAVNGGLGLALLGRAAQPLLRLGFGSGQHGRHESAQRLGRPGRRWRR